MLSKTKHAFWRCFTVNTYKYVYLIFYCSITWFYISSSSGNTKTSLLDKSMHIFNVAVAVVTELNEITFHMLKASDMNFVYVQELYENIRNGDKCQNHVYDCQAWNFNPCHSKLIFRKYTNMIVFSIISRNFDEAGRSNSAPWYRHGPVSPAWSIPWLLMPWRHKEPGNQQPWYWCRSLGIFRFQHQWG